MSEQVGEGVVRIRVDDSGVNSSAIGKQAGDGYKKGFGSALKGLGGVLLGGVAAAGAINFLKGANEEARESQKVSAQTAQTIKATGGAANITAGQVGRLAGSLSEKAAVDDELVQTGANLLLTFKNVRNEVGAGNDVFNQATAAALDLSAAGFGSVEGASVMLGKALNDPVKGMSALGRAGVTFTQQQQEQVKALVAQGDLLGAQKVILGEVEGQVGGVAEATATAGEKATVAWGNVKETVGTALLPVLDTLANVFVSVIAPAITEVVNSAALLGPVFSTVGSIIGSIFGGGGGGPGATISAFATQIKASVVPVLETMATTFQTVILPAVITFGQYLATQLWPIIKQVADIIATQVVPTVASLAQFLYGTLYPAIFAIVTQVATRLQPVFEAVVDVIATRILPTVSRLVQQVRTQLIPALQPLVVKVVAVIGWLLKLAAAILAKVLPPLLRLAGFLISKVVPAIVSVITFIAKVVNKVLDWGAAIGKGIGFLLRFQGAIIGLVKDGLTRLFDAVASLPGRIIGLGSRFLNAGKQIIGAFVNGLKNAGGVVSDIAGNVWDAVRGLLNNAIDRINASLSFTISLPGPDISVNPPDIPHLQGGTLNWPGGRALVGEVGPEEVWLPQGARVLTAAQTRQQDGLIDYERLAAAIIAALLAAGKDLRPVQFVLPSGDPEAAAMAVLNRLVAG